MRPIDALGQKTAASILQGRVEKARVGDTLLFHGPRGLGKDYLGRELMKVLNCLEPATCGSEGRLCPSCRKVGHFNHPDFQYVFPVVRGHIRSSSEKSFQQFLREKSDLVAGYHQAMQQDPFFHPEDDPKEFDRPPTHTVDTVRNLLVSSSKRLYEAQAGVVVLSSAHLMTQGAANALLKVLEEPPPDRQFVLTTDTPDALLPTILSRCQRVRFTPLQEAEVVSILRRFLDLDEEAARALARRAQGIPGRAVRLHHEARVPLIAAAGGFFRLLVEKAPSAVLDQAVSIAGGSREEVLGILDELVLFYRDTMVLADGGSRDSVVQVESLDLLSKLAGEGTLGDPNWGMTRIEQARREIRRNANARLSVTRLALDLKDRCRPPAAP
jgi:DNA polymerase-3 subunit delta'